MTSQISKNQTSTRAIATLILGILSISCLGIFSAIPAIILGLQELKAIKTGAAPAAGDLIAKIGLVLGVIVVTLTVLIILAMLTFTIIPHTITFNSQQTGVSI